MRLTLFFLFLSCSISSGQITDVKKFDFTKADSIALAHKGKSLRNLPVLTHELTAKLTTDVEKFRAIFTWVCTNIENDYQSYLRTRKERNKIRRDREGFLQWNNRFTPKVFEKLVSERKTACTGYAYLINEMANLAGFQSKIINGYGRTPTLLLDLDDPPNHSWNAIKLDGQWYLCDATWSAGKVMLDDVGPRFEPDYNDVYFLPDPNLFIKNHYPLEKELSLLEEFPTLNEFMEGPVLYVEAFSHGVIPTVPQKMRLEAIRDENVGFELEVPDSFEVENLRLTLNSGGRDFEVQPKITKLAARKVLLEYAYERTGLFDTHIKVDDNIITTYVIRVRRK